jgi:CheY-like chemotaxis protein
MLLQEPALTVTGARAMHDGSHRLIAVIDDDEAVRDSLRFLLEIAGHSVATYGSALQFLREAPMNQLACVLVDQHMPDQTGLQLVAQLRADGVGLAVALITGSPSKAKKCSSEVTTRDPAFNSSAPTRQNRHSPPLASAYSRVAASSF